MVKTLDSVGVSLMLVMLFLNIDHAHNVFTSLYTRLHLVHTRTS